MQDDYFDQVCERDNPATVDTFDNIADLEAGPHSRAAGEHVVDTRRP